MFVTDRLLFDGLCFLPAPGKLLGFPHVESLRQDGLEQPGLLLNGFQRKDGPGVACRQGPLCEGLADFLRELEQPQGVRDGGAVLPHGDGDGFVGETEFVYQPVKGLGFLQGVEICPQEVFDKRENRRVLISGIPDDDGYILEAGFLGGPPSALAGDDLVAPVRLSCHDGLNDTALADGGNEALVLLRVEILSRLVAIRHQLLDAARHENRLVADLFQQVGEHGAQAFSQRVLL